MLFVCWLFSSITIAQKQIEINITPQLNDLCLAKLDVVSFAYSYRDKGLSLEDAKRVLDRDWNQHWSHLKHATYVDMNRIIQDGWRTKKDNTWVHTPPDINQLLMREYYRCIIEQY